MAENITEVTPEVQAVLDRFGITWDEYTTWVVEGRVPEALGASGAPAGAFLNEIKADVEAAGAPELQYGEAPAGYEFSPASPKADLLEIAAEDIRSEALGIVDKIASGEATTEDFGRASEIALDPTLGEEMQAILAAVTGGYDPQLQQALNAAGVFGLSLEDIDWAAGYEALMENFGDTLGASFLPSAKDPGVSEEDFNQSAVQRFLASNPTGFAQMVLLSDMIDEGNQVVNATFGQSNTSGSTIQGIMSANGVSFTKATKLADLAADAGVDPALGAHAWKTLYDMGWVVGDRIDRQDMAHSAPDWFKAWISLVPDEDGEVVNEQFANPELADELRGMRDQLEEQRAFNELNDDIWEVKDTTKFIRSGARVMSDLNAALETYKTALPAMLSLTNKDLADRLMEDPYSLTWDELLAVQESVGDIGFFQTEPGGAAQVRWLESRLGGSKDVVTVDKNAVREATRTLANSWNLPGLSDAFLDSVAGSFAGAQANILKRTLGNPFNPDLSSPEGEIVDSPTDQSAFAADRIRNTDQYRTYFSHLGEGESELDYVAKFESQAARLLGFTDDEATRAGMRTGDRRAVGQHVLASGEWEDSSTFQSRLSRLANAFRQVT